MKFSGGELWRGASDFITQKWREKLKSRRERKNDRKKKKIEKERKREEVNKASFTTTQPGLVISCLPINELAAKSLIAPDSLSFRRANILSHRVPRLYTCSCVRTRIYVHVCNVAAKDRIKLATAGK